MTIDTKTLKKIPLFEGISEEEISEIMPCLGVTIKLYSKNQTILFEGDTANKFGVVLDGSIRMTQMDYSGNRNVIGVMGKYDLFAEAYACSDIERYPVSAVAAENCTVMMIESARIHSSCIKSCNTHRVLIRNLLRIVAGKNIQLNQKIEFMSKRTTKEKLMAYLYSEADRTGKKSFTIPFDRQALADYLSVDRSAMSSEIGKLRDEGLIEVEKSNFKILV